MRHGNPGFFFTAMDYGIKKEKDAPDPTGPFSIPGRSAGKNEKTEGPFLCNGNAEK